MSTRLRVALVIGGIVYPGRDAVKILKAYERDFVPTLAELKVPPAKRCEIIFDHIPDRDKRLFVTREPKGLTPDKSPYVRFLKKMGAVEVPRFRGLQQTQVRWEPVPTPPPTRPAPDRNLVDWEDVMYAPPPPPRTRQARVRLVPGTNRVAL